MNTNFFIKSYKSKDNIILTVANVTHYINLFWKDVINKLEHNKKANIIMHANLEEGYRALSKFVLVDHNSKELYINFILSLLAIKDDYYTESPVTAITFKYFITESSEIINENYYKEFEPVDYTNIRINGIKPMKLPNNMNYKSWGDLIFESDNLLLIQYVLKNNYYVLQVDKNTNKCIIKKSSTTIVSFVDIVIAENYFIRTIDNYNYYYILNNVVITNTPNKKIKYITEASTDKNISNHIITLDIETKLINNIITPYCICYFDGKNKYSFYLTDYESPDIMIKECLKSLLDHKYNRRIVYVHNLSLFDGIFLMGPLSELNNPKFGMQILKRDNNIISIKFFLANHNQFYIEFRDSLLILPSSLKKLSEIFNEDDHQKDIFPYSFVDDNDLDYVGVIPEFKYFNNVSNEEYNNYSEQFNNNWSLKNEAIKYCLQDCISLYYVLVNFNKIYHDKFKINIHKYPTISSLALATFRAKFLDSDKIKIPVISGSMYKEIKAGYTGGSVDVIYPYGENVKVYDINSLYPTVMATCPMPIGPYTKFEGDIRNIINNPFGFFEVEINAPDNIKHPILQTKVKTESGYRTISPIGHWTDMIFSEEMFNAEKYGYTFNILRGYLFNKQIIFKEYIESLYEIKQSVHKSNPMYLISKLLQNSLYGRFGLNYEFPEHYIVNNNKLNELNNNNSIQLGEVTKLTDDLNLVGIFKPSKYNMLDIDDVNFKSQISLPIAAAVTAYARIFMSQFKNRDDFKLLYFDTDSAFIIGDLDPNLIGNKLGQFKLEYIFKKCIILSPKVYGGILEDGSELIKVKGLKKDSINEHLTVDILESLLHKDSNVQVPNLKFIRDFSNRSINLRNDLYTLMVSDNKRKLIYNDNNIFSSTESFCINNQRLIINK